MDDTLNYEIHVKRIEFQENQVWRVIDEQSVSIQHEPTKPRPTVQTAHSALCYAFAQNQQLCTSKVYTLKDQKLKTELPTSRLKADQTYYVVFKQKTIPGKTIGQILDDCYIAEVTQLEPERAQQPYFPYIFQEHVLTEMRTENEGTYNRQPKNTLLVFWRDFDQQFQLFFEEPNAKLTVLISADKLPRANDTEAIIISEADSKSFMRKPLDDVVRGSAYKGMIIQAEYSKGAGIFDFAFVDRFGNLKLLIEAKLPCMRGIIDSVSGIIELFQQQSPGARPINQIVNYLLFNNVRYGILTTLRHNYAFERIGNQIRVSRVKEDVELLKLVFYLLHQSENHTEHEALSEDDILPVKIDQEGNVQCPSVNPNTRPDYSVYFDSCDDFADPDDMDELVHARFINWEFKIGQTILGHGRTGCVTLGQVWSMDSPNDKYPVAVKVADLYKRPYLEDEMRNEARVLMYANNAGLKCVPRLRWAGHFGHGAQFYVICTEYINGVKRDLDKLSENEQLMFAAAQDELQSAAIIHGDIKKPNVIFTESRCYLIDYGMAKILTQATPSENAGNCQPD